MDRRKAMRSAVALVAVHNIAQNTILNQRGYVVGNLLVGGTLIGLGKASGLALSDMGLSPELEKRDIRLVGLAAAITAGGSLAALSQPKARALLREERTRDTARSVIVKKALIRFPIGTALFEETVFRGTLPALAAGSNARGDLLSAGLFGLWHLIPTARALSGSPMSVGISAAQRAKGIMIGSTATVLGGLGFSWLRRRTGTIVVPWLTHSAFNTITYLAGVLAWRFGDRP